MKVKVDDQMEVCVRRAYGLNAACAVYINDIPVALLHRDGAIGAIKLIGFGEDVVEKLKSIGIHITRQNRITLIRGTTKKNISKKENR
jgi:hypothetical protein